jgi:ubiquinone/menaquinone biosynthesis C-methylase UbiE
MDIWSRYAEAYDKIMPCISYYNELNKDAFIRLKGLRKIIDVGAGTGILLEKLLGGDKELHGIDSNEVMLHFASRKFTKNDNVHLYLSNSSEMGFKNNSFDGAACMNVIYCVDRPLDTLREIHRILKKNGVLVISGPRKGINSEVLKKRFNEDIESARISLSEEIYIFEECNKQLINGFKNLYDNPEMESLLKEAGFLEILESSRAYLGQSYLIIAKK